VTLLEVWDSIWIGCLGSSILFGLYRAVEWRWPERYLGMHETFGLSSQETWLRFVAYRAVPTYLVVATCCVTVGRVGGSPWIAAIVMWLLSIVLTHGRIVFDALRSRRGEVNYAGYHLQMILLLTAVIVVAVMTGDSWGKLVPQPEEFLIAIWSGLLVAGLGGFVIVTLKPRSESAPYYGASYFIERATRDVGLDLMDWLFTESLRTGADPVLLKSILVVEAVQRPRWLRRIERVGVSLGIAKTSGVMQMTSTKALSDKDSITLAAEAYAGLWSLRYRDSGEYSMWEPDLGSLWPVATRHNGDGAFAEAVGQVANSLIYGSPAFNYTDSPDRGVVLELRRYPEHFALRGVTTSAVVVVVESSDGKVLNLGQATLAIAAPGSLRAWEAQVSPRADEIRILDVQGGVGTTLHLKDGEITKTRPIRVSTATPDLVASEGQIQPTSPAGDADDSLQAVDARKAVAGRLRASRSSRGPRIRPNSSLRRGQM